MLPVKYFYLNKIKIIFLGKLQSPIDRTESRGSDVEHFGFRDPAEDLVDDRPGQEVCPAGKSS